MTRAPAKGLPTPQEFEEQLARFINGTLLGGNAAVDRDSRLFEDGYMNSLRILDLIAMVEKTLDRRVPDRAVRLANFRTIATIVRAFHPDATSEAAASTTPDRIFERRENRARFASPLAALRARGDVALGGPGRVALSGFALDVLHAVDHTVSQWARELNATEHRYPSLIDPDVLKRAGKADSVPEDLTLHNDMFPPAVCYHAYPEWEGKTLRPEPTLLTARGRCSRYEDGSYVPLERLRQFTMREIIILGSRDQVDDARHSLVRQVSELVTMLELDAAIDLAADPFFTSADEGRRLMQQAAALKYELRLTIDEAGRTIAAASFNHHQDFFGTRFDIRLADGTPAHSGCVAFGLERWVLALCAQHGVDHRAWPDAAREWLEDHISTHGAEA
jgi:acyl carrier protein